MTPLQLLGLLCIALVYGPANARSDREVEKELAEIARAISAKLPSGSPASMVVSVTAGPGRRFTYRSVQAVPAREWTPEMRAHSLRIAVNDYCTNPVFQPLRDNGVVVSWQSSDREGVHVTTNSVAPGDCKK